MRTFGLLVVVVCGLLAWIVTESVIDAQNDADVVGDFGSPIPGLTEPELSTFEFGRNVFVRRFRREEGLGRHFNSSSCVSCHEAPEPGGSSQRYRDFFLVGNLDVNDRVVPLYPPCTAENEAEQDSELCLPSLVMPHYGPKGTIDQPVALEVEHPRIPEGTEVVAARNAPPLFGIGLFRLVSDSEILSRADPGDADGDGISGRVNLITKEAVDGGPPPIGRFGYKCQTASIEAFNRGALQNQMGITSDSTQIIIGALESPKARGWLEDLLGARVAHAQVAEPRDRIVDFDGVRDPEISRAELLALVFFQEHLAAPRPGRRTASVQRGEAVFERIGCTGCHAPSLETPMGLIHPYTDLLIHDMGPELADGITMEGATASEFRTQPLWGLCQHAPFLHDGRADTVSQAILLHGGEGTAARDSYANLSEEDRVYLHRFLESL